ncbi:hypothetical protein [Rhodobacter ferrooxidans]|uniref:Uncharacterized protein n=1 Tax=Rhodobacter ferrooxidans TaxID=371731 RepID=C8RXE7_9RHOB|nr:hypothetical protein [Rhodobacter sp. SW2]EEW26672.1 conserved hypothetical protein [Rhodobacter sp. SW2]
MAAQFAALLRELTARSGEALMGRIIASLASAVLLIVALGFLTAGGFGFLAARIGAPMAALTFAALFAVLALLVDAISRVNAKRRRQQAEAARAQLTSQVSTQVAAASLVLKSAGWLPLLAAFLAAFALARKQ